MKITGRAAHAVVMLALLLVATPASCGANPAPDRAAGPAAGASSFREALVVDEHDAPVAQAEVAFRADDATGVAADQAADCEPSFAGLPRHRSGADGVVRLPTDLACVMAFARKGERFGSGSLEFDDRRLARPVLRIAPERNLRVLVEGPDGRPRRGVPIEVVPPASR